MALSRSPFSHPFITFIFTFPSLKYINAPTKINQNLQINKKSIKKMEKTKKIIRVWAYKVAPNDSTISQKFTALNIAVNTVELIVKITEGKPSISNFTGGVIEEYDTVICEISEEMASTLKHAFPFISILNP